MTTTAPPKPDTLPSAKWVDGLSAETPLDKAAKKALKARLRLVEAYLPEAALRADEDIEFVHQLRVYTRRSGAALKVFKNVAGKKERKAVSATLKALRRAAGDARDADVHGEALRELADRAGETERRAIAFLLERIGEEREQAQRELIAAYEAHPHERLKAERKALLKSLKNPKGRTLLDAARRVLPEVADTVLEAGARDLTDLENLHELRKDAKRLRYAMELFAPCFDASFKKDLYARVELMQDMLGSVNDSHTMLLRLERAEQAVERGVFEADDRVRRGLGALIERHLAQREQRREAFLDWWGPVASSDFFPTLRAAVLGEAVVEPAPIASPPAGEDATRPIDGEPAPVERTIPREPAPGEALAPDVESDPNRLAAIDVGTNSIRLIVAELTDDGAYRVLDDEKAITRLGRGLSETGRMPADAIDASVEAIARMRSIARGFGAAQVRAVGTAVCREAENIADLTRAVLERTGLELEVISAEREAQLAFRSVAAAFDIEEQAVAIVDIGGGSTEIVLSSRGLVEQVYTIPIGAVRLTERFGGADDATGKRYDELRGFIKSTLKAHIGKAPFTPSLIIGTGGTLTTIANVSLHQQRGALWAEGSSASVRGHEMQRSDVRHMLERLRKMSLTERERVAGLPPDRADIIVGGIAIVEALMKRLGVNVVRVHDRGIRDGLLLEMADAARGVDRSEVPSDPMRSVRRFSSACSYDHRHCEHVAALSLQVFDQLRAHYERLAAKGDEAARRQVELLSGDARLLLEAAAVLQDVGYHINYTRHHKHSYHLIAHADLPGFSPRQTRIIANVARYHRRAAPKMKHPNFASLSPADRDLVRALSGIVRVAGGLDRTHMQKVSAARLAFDDGVAHFIVEAAHDPHVEIWGAQNKAALFEDVFGLRPSFEWAPPMPEPAGGRGDREPLG